MARNVKRSGYTLIELLLVLVIIGVISAIAIPSFMGQRHRARSIGDAQANSQVMQMQLESLKADQGIYGAVGAYNWYAATGADANMLALLPNFTPKSKMNFNLAITGTGTAAGLTYLITVSDTTIAGSPNIYIINQSGTVTLSI